MTIGFRGWLYRFLAVAFGLVGIIVALSLAEVSRFYGFPKLQPGAGVALGLACLLLFSAFVGEWRWKRYALITVIGTGMMTLGYLAFRPEMIRDDVLKQLPSPPLSVDLLVYREFVLREDPERAVKIERLQLLYGMLRSYGARDAVSAPEPTPVPQE